MKRIVVKCIVALLASWLAELPDARADLVDQFKEAATKTGCDAIPYSDMQSTCRSQMRDVNHWCGGYKGPVRCEIGRTESLLSQIDEEKQFISSSRDKRRELEERRARAVDARKKAELLAQIEQLDKDVEAAAKRIEEAKQALSKHKDALEAILYTNTKCTEFRRAVAGVVIDARNKVAGESDPKLKEYAGQLIGEHDSFAGSQESSIKNLTNSFNACKKAVPSVTVL